MDIQSSLPPLRSGLKSSTATLRLAGWLEAADMLLLCSSVHASSLLSPLIVQNWRCGDSPSRRLVPLAAGACRKEG